MADWYKTKEKVDKEQQIRNNRNKIRELKNFLKNTDHKVLPDYEVKQQENIEEIKEERKIKRRELRQLIEITPEETEE